MTYFQAYLLTRLDSLNDFFTGGMIVFIVGLIPLIGWIITKDDLNEEFPVYRVFLYFVAFLFMALGKVATPTTKEAAFIYIAPAIVNNQDIQKTIKKIPELSGLGLEYLSEVLKEEIKDTKNQIKQGVK